MHNRLLAIVGPTAVGKSALALTLANRLDGEIVSADSRQVYRYMDIGTAKPSLENRAAIPHHLIDIVDPDENYSLALFLRQAREAIQGVQQRSRLPILVGGTGQYVRALLDGWQVPEVPPNLELRERLEKQARGYGALALHQELARLDPVASRIDPRNVRRVIRALEVSYSRPNHSTGAPRKLPPPYQATVLGLTLQRRTLYQRIDDRVDMMARAGWVDEVRGLLDRGYGPDLPSLTSLGYREMVQYLRGELSLNAAVEQIKRSTRSFARHQYAWFRPADERIRWFDAAEGLGRAESEVIRWLAGPRPAPVVKLVKPQLP